ncbi:MAG: hypothetical protein MR681_03365 [Prevotella sp.]|nr:hypothetical protein [Prevotella sp.]
MGMKLFCQRFLPAFLHFREPAFGFRKYLTVSIPLVLPAKSEACFWQNTSKMGIKRPFLTVFFCIRIHSTLTSGIVHGFSTRHPLRTNASSLVCQRMMRWTSTHYPLHSNASSDDWQPIIQRHFPFSSKPSARCCRPPHPILPVSARQQAFF